MIRLVMLFLKEELRLRRSFSTALSLLVFPEMVFLGAIGGYIFSSVYMGSMDHSRLHLSILSGLFIFGISMGGIAFLGKEFIERSLGPVNMMAASSTYHPIGPRTMYTAYFLHDLLFYMVLVLIPSSLGLLLGTIVEPMSAGRFLTITSSHWTVFLLGLSLSLLVSSIIARRKRLLLLMVPLTLLPLILLQLLTGEMGAYVPAYLSITGGSWIWILLTLVLSVLYAGLGIALFAGVDVSYKKGSVGSYDHLYERARSLLGDSRYSALVARELITLVRGKAYVRMLFSLFFPVLVITVLVGLIGGMEGSPMELNLPFLAVMVSFFTMSIYTHLTNMDHLDYDQTLPVRVPDLVRVKVWVYLLLAIPISVFFLLVVGIVQWNAFELLVSIVLVLVMVPYMGFVTAYLTGLWTNSMLFDPSVFLRYIAMTVGPLMFATLLSMLMEEMNLVSLLGIAVVLIGSVLSTVILSRSMDRKWGDLVLSSAGMRG